MPSPNHARNGETPPRVPPPSARGSPHPHHHFHSTVSAQKLRRINFLVLLLRIAAFCFSLASAIFMVTNSSGPRSWLDSDPFRFVFAANAIVAVYSLFEMGASIWEILRGSTLLPESVQLWFDFGHDQLFAYLLLSAEAAGTGEAVAMRRRKGGFAADSAFSIQTDISIALGFVGFVFLALSTLMSGFRVACYLITGSRFHL